MFQRERFAVIEKQCRHNRQRSGGGGGVISWAALGSNTCAAAGGAGRSRGVLGAASQAAGLARGKANQVEAGNPIATKHVKSIVAGRV